MPSHHTAGWPDLLAQIQQYLIQHNKPQLRGFISFAWEKDGAKNAVLQEWLKTLQEDLMHAGFADVFLDIKNMSGNLQETMRAGLANSQVIFFICNPRFVARLKEADKERGLGFEVQEVLAAAKKSGSELMVLPILQAGTPEESIPELLQEFVDKHGFIDFSKEYQKKLTGFMDADGLIPKAYQINVQDREYQAILRRHYLSTVLQDIPKLFGRESALTELATRFESQPVQILCGEPGVGKSALAMTHAKVVNSSYAFVRYLRITEEHDWVIALDEFAQDLSVPRTELSATLSALPNWLVIIDSNNLELPWQEVFSSISLSKEQHILLVTQASSAHEAITISALAEEDAMEMVHHYLADIPAQEQQLVTKYAGVPKDLVKAIHYIQNSPWLDLTDFLTHGLTPSELPMRAGTMQQEEVQLQVAPPKKWDVLKQDIRELIQVTPEKIKVGMLSEADTENASKVSLHKDLTECGIDIQEAADTEQFEAIKALVILNTPDFKEACEKQEDAILKWHKEKVSLLPLVIDGEFQEVLPEFLHKDFLARPLDTNQEAAYQKMLMGLINPLGIIPAICGFAAGHKAYEHNWYNYWLSNLPDIGRFIGRTEFLTNIHTKLHERNSQSIVAITGMGGFGKTSVAIRYGEIHKADYDLVRVIDSDAPVLQSSIYSFAKDLGIETKGKKISDVLELLHRELANISNYLLIFDNVEQFAVIKDYLPSIKEGQHIIITSRDDHGVDWPQSIKFAEFTPAEATEYVLAELQEQNEELGKQLGYLPLALKTAVAFIKEKRNQGDYAIGDYLREAQASMTSGDSPVMKSLKLSLSKISTQSTDALTILRYCAFLAPEHIMPLWFKDLSDLTIPRIYDGLMVLTNYSMLGVKNKGLTIHRLMQDAIRNSIELSQEQVLTNYLIPLTETIRTIYPKANSRPRPKEKFTVLLPPPPFLPQNAILSIGAETAQNGISQHALIKEPLSTSKTFAYAEKYKHDDYDFIKQLIPHIVVLNQHLQGQQTLSAEVQLKNDTARDVLLGYLSDAYRATGNFSQECVVLQESLAMKGKCYGLQHPEYVKTLKVLANAHGSLGNYSEQRCCLEEAIAIYKQNITLENREELYKQTLIDLIKTYELLGASVRDKIYTVLAEAEEDIDIRHIALSTLEKFPATREQANQLFSALLKATKDEDANVRQAVYNALAKLEISEHNTSQLFPILLAAIENEDGVLISETACQVMAALKLSPEQSNQLFQILLVVRKPGRSGYFMDDVWEVLVKLGLSPQQNSQLFSALLAATKDEHPGPRINAWQDMPKLKLSPEQTNQRFSALLKATKDECVSVRLAALEAITKLEFSSEQINQLFPTLLAMTKDEDKRVRQTAWEVLAKLELSTEKTSQWFSALIATIQDCAKDDISEDEDAAIDVLAGLRFSPEQSNQFFLALFTATKDADSDAVPAFWIVNAALKLSTEQISQWFSALLKATKDEDANARRAAWQAMEILKLSPEQTSQLSSELLIAAIKDENERVRQAACLTMRVLKLSTEQLSQLFPTLLAATKDGHENVRRAAWIAMTYIKFSPEQTIQLFPTLLTAIKDGHEYIQKQFACKELARLELSPEQVSQLFPALSAATKDEDKEVRLAALQAMATLELSPEQTSQRFLTLLAATEDKAGWVRTTAWEVLDKLELSSEQTSQWCSALFTAAIDEEEEVREITLRAIVNLELSSEQISQLFPILLSAINDENDYVRNIALQAVTTLEFSTEQISQLVTSLFAATKNEYGIIKEGVKKTLVKLEFSPEQTSQLLPTLLTAIKDEHLSVRQTAWEVLAKLEFSPEQTTQLFPALLKATKDEHNNVNDAYKTLAKLSLSPEQTNRLFLALLAASKEEHEYSIRHAACKTLAALKLSSEQGSQRFSALLSATKDEHKKVRIGAYETLATLKLSSEQTSQLFQILLTATKDKSEYVRLAVYQAMSKLALPQEQTNQRFSAMLKATKDEDELVRWIVYPAILSLGLSTEQTNQLFLVLLAAIKDENKSVRQSAWITLAILDLSPKQTSQLFPELFTAAKDEEEHVRKAVWQAIIKLELSPEQTSQLFPVLLAATKDEDMNVSQAAWQAMAILALSPEQASQRFLILLAATKDKNISVRWAASHALAKLELSTEQTNQLFLELLKAMNDEDGEIIWTSCATLAKLELSPEQTNKLFPAILAATKDKDKNVKLTAWEAISKLELSPEQTSQLFPFLLAAAKNKDKNIRYAACQAMANSELSPEQTERVLSTILPRIKCTRLDERRDAYHALAKLKLSPAQTSQLFSALLKATKDEHLGDIQAYQAITKLTLSPEQTDHVSQRLLRLLIVSQSDVPILKAVAKESLAILYGRESELTKQLELLVQALAIKKALLGSKHIEYAQTLMLLAQYYVDVGNVETALTYFTKALPIIKNEYGVKDKFYKDCLTQQQQAQEKLDFIHTGSGGSPAFLLRARRKKAEIERTDGSASATAAISHGFFSRDAVTEVARAQPAPILLDGAAMSAFKAS